ncbi:uncharacterized protein BX664DRAFT_343257 [Halteromyces radiatus]|uniref:uncharacterized protein n=1 Tax=Halteromyces radiatus TaxID=101107 RepID=UPI00222117C9|nr:uncharacterized protein BX664DRAFT_343257 [Halteromyces radiatus]KAI8077697.1 hypothetical protein BX664DRAFT_343257 [Halteromyces radiatus]
MDLLSSPFTSLPSVFTMPTSSCYFETLHKSTESVVSIQDLINAPSKIEPVLDQLTMEQITTIEQSIRKIKKRKAREANEMTTNKKKKISEKSKNDQQPVNPNHRTVLGPPAIEIRDGIEWVSFVYSHNRVLKRYSIRTDIDDICLDDLDEKFQLDNCVYPRANVPKETYQGNRWNYETQCNVLGWKLASINDCIAGKRGLIQRAVDSYRNRNPNMRSRRVTRQTKLLNGTLRRRKTINTPNDESASHINIPKTMTMEDEHQERFRVKITLDQVDLNDIDPLFRAANCVYPRSMRMDSTSLPDQQQQRRLEENMLNELGWKLAWLNPRLVNKRNLLQRALDLYRLKFLPIMAPRKNSARTAPTTTATQLTSWLLSTLDQPSNEEECNDNNDDIIIPVSPSTSCTTESTESLDFSECFSLEEDDMMMDGCDMASINTSLTTTSTTLSYGSILNTPTSSPVDLLEKQLLECDPSTCSTLCGNICLFEKDMPLLSSTDNDNNNNNNNNGDLMMADLPSNTMMDFTQTYDNSAFDHDLLIKMEQTADDLFNFL